MSDMERLIAAVEAGTASQRDSWTAVCAFGDNAASRSKLRTYAGGAYSGSLDAAHRLHEALLPGWWWGRFAGTGEMYVTHMDSTDVPDCYAGDTPARAWLLAILRALQATTETGRE